MATFCRHTRHRTITKIFAPKYSTNEILINTLDIVPKIEHYLFQFSEETPKHTYGWFYLSGKIIRASKKQPNGRGEVYVVSLDKRENFNPLTECEHQYK